MKKPKGEYAIQTVVNAMRLLEAFRDEEELGVTELSIRLGLHKNNVFRLLATLQQQGYVEQGPSERYCLGVRSVELGQSFLRGRTLLRRAGPFLEKLARCTRESAHLSLLRGFEVVLVAAEAGNQVISAGLRVGERLPAHCTASGKVLLGCGSEEVREAFDREVVAGGPLASRTPATIVDAHKFFEHLRTVSVSGYAVDLGECELGLACAAAPVFDRDGRLLAALSVSGPEFRMGEDRLRSEIVPLVVEASEALSRHLGFAA